MKKAKKRNALGLDGIPIEAIKAQELGLDLVHHLLKLICETGDVPEEMPKSVFITLPEKAGVNECENFMTISLMSHILKLLLNLVLQRIAKKAHLPIRNEQFGFMPDTRTRNAILRLRVIAGRLLNHQQKIFICFIDFVEAFDKVWHYEMLDALDGTGVDDKDIGLLQNICWKQKSTVKVGNEEMDNFNVKVGVRQGCVASPLLYNTFSERIMQSIEYSKGVSVGGMNIT